MKRIFLYPRVGLTLFVLLVSLSSACRFGFPENPSESSQDVNSFPNSPQINSVNLARTEVPRYESMEFRLQISASYTNPYDVREISLDGSFTAPDGTEMRVPGFWDGVEVWRLRFTPSQEGEWRYQLRVSDLQGTSLPSEGTFNVTSSDHHGWLQVGNWVDPEYSRRYLAYHDGTAFYGVGHCDALNILVDGFSEEDGVGLFNNMTAANENYVVWWPFYSHSVINNSYADYTVSNLTLIDLIVEDAQQKGITLIFTVWDHPQLRDSSHSWNDGRWEGYNGFHELSDIDSFFTSDEVWSWQENLYRYIIARWGYSPAIGMWQTITEINGTNAYDQTNPWHEKVNAYFVESDPYHHPTTASMSGESSWPEGFLAMDIPQIHVYSVEDAHQKDVVKAAATFADRTAMMWDTGKPNWIGEFGVRSNAFYPELFHNAVWAALSSGAAMTPAEWNSFGTWGQMTPEMYAVMTRLARFVEDIPLVIWDPSRLEVKSLDTQVRGWGLGAAEGGLLWVQDFSLEGETIEAVRTSQPVREAVQLEISGLETGTYIFTPYNTWIDEFLDRFEVDCQAAQPCTLPLPAFTADLAVKFERK